jgi:hypothetical protein
MLCIGGTLGKGTLRMYPSLRVPTAKTALAPALVNVTDPHPKARRAGTVPPPPSRAPPLLVVGCRCTLWSGGRPLSPRPGVVLVRRRRHRGRQRSPSPPAPISVVLVAAVAAALTLASAITIAAASADVTASPTLLSIVGCCVVCRPSPTASSTVQIYQPPPSCDRRHFCFWAAVPFCLPSPATVLLLFYRASTAFAAPVDVWLLHSPPTQQHTDHITKLKRIQFPPSWTYFDLLRVSTCLF